MNDLETIKRLNAEAEAKSRLSLHRGEVKALVKLLEDAKVELVEHDREYHHQTEKSVLERLERTLARLRAIVGVPANDDQGANP